MGPAAVAALHNLIDTWDVTEGPVFLNSRGGRLGTRSMRRIVKAKGITAGPGMDAFAMCSFGRRMGLLGVLPCIPNENEG